MHSTKALQGPGAEEPNASKVRFATVPFQTSQTGSLLDSPSKSLRFSARRKSCSQRALTVITRPVDLRTLQSLTLEAAGGWLQGLCRTLRLMLVMPSMALTNLSAAWQNGALRRCSDVSISD